MKRFFTLFLALTLALSCLFIAPLSVNAATDKPIEVLKSDNTSFGTYATMPEALAAALNADLDDFTIRLLENLTLAGNTTLNCTKPVSYTLDGNGFTMKQTAAAVAITVNGVEGAELTISNFKMDAADNSVVVNNGKVNFVNSSFYSAASNTIVVRKTENTTGIKIEANFISGSVISESGYSLYANNASGQRNGDCVVNIYGGYFATKNAADNVLSTDYSIVNIYGGTICNLNTASGKYAAYSNGSSANTIMNVYGGNFVVSQDSSHPVVRSHATKDCAMNIYGGNFSGGVGYSNIKNSWSYYGAGKIYSNPYNNGSPVTAGYSARLTEGTSGLRFTSTISKAVIDRVTALADAGTTLSYGTLIAPTASISAGAFTIDALNVAGKVAGTDYVDVAANEGLTFDAAGNAKINAAIIKIKAANYTKSFSAIAYIKATINGQTVYFYGAYDEAKNQSSIANVATLALADVKETAEGNYTNLVSDGSAQDGKYSPYTAAQRAVLAAYLAAAN